MLFFYQTFGRETTPSGSELRKRKKTKAFSRRLLRTSSTPRTLSRNQHPIKWKKDIEARDNKETDLLDAFEAFFEQSKLQTFYFKSQDVKRFYSIGKDIIEVVVKELLIDDQEKLDGNIAMRAFKAKAVKDDSGEVISYTVAVKKKVQFNHVLDHVAADLSIRQIAKVIRSDRENLDAAAKIGSVSHGEASSMACIGCAIGLQSLSEIMRAHWAFSIGALTRQTNKGRTLTLT